MQHFFGSYEFYVNLEIMILKIFPWIVDPSLPPITLIKKSLKNIDSHN